MFSTNYRGSWQHKIISVVSLFAVVGMTIPSTTFAATLFSDGFEPNPNHFVNWTSVDGSPSGKWGSSSSGVHSGAFSAQVNGDTGSSDDILRKSISTAGYTSVSLSFWYKADDLESSDNDRLRVYYTTNGSTWTEVSSLQVDDDNDDENWHSLSATLPADAANKPSFGFRFAGDLDDGNDKIWIDDVVLAGDAIPADVCPNVAGTQTTTPCADTTCVNAGGTWNGSSCDMPVVDVCINVPGTQAAGPCADTTCELGGGFWNGSSCDADACANVAGYQAAGPCADDTCTQGGGFWNGSTCVPDACPQVPNFQESGPCANDTCVAEQGTWNGSTCDMPIDVCPLVDGLQVNPPCANDTCTQSGGIWVENQCTADACVNVLGHQSETPCADTTCELAGGTWVVVTCVMPVDVCPADEGMQLVGPCVSEDVCPNDVGIQTDTEDCTPEVVDACPSMEGTQQSVEECPETQTCDEGQHLEGEQCVNDEVPPTEETPTSGGGGGGGGGSYLATCMNGVDDDMDGLTDMTDPGCVNPFDGSEVNDAPAPATGGATTTASTTASTGEVLGATTGPAACDARFTVFIMRSNKVNDEAAVKDLQAFLNESMGAGLPITGFYGPKTIAAVKAFQKEFKSDVLDTWPTNETGNFYQSTQWTANKKNCEMQGLEWTTPFPTLSIFKKA